MSSIIQSRQFDDLPFVFSMGPQRSATSWLDRYLRVRGDICLPSDVKEIFFFDRHYDRGIDFYKSHFKPIPAHKFAMEISTTSFDDPDAPKRLRDMFGSDITLLCPLRHPVVRSYSLYLHYVRYGIVMPGFTAACRSNPQIIESSYYARHVENWMRVFPNIQINFVFQEELEVSQDVFVKSVCDALSLPFMSITDQAAERYNSTTFSGSSHVARMAQRGADVLRKNGLYSVINFAKAMGLKRVIFGKENPDANSHTIPEDHKAFLDDQLLPEIERLESLIGPIQWWNNR